MNKWTGIGRLTKNSELRYTPSGVAITTFTLAVDRRFKNAQGERETDFFTIKTFKQLAELCAQYLDKGKLAGVSGELQIRTYDDKDGQKHWMTEIIADEVQFLSPKSASAGDQQEQPPQQTTPPAQGGQQNPPGNMPPPPSYNGTSRADGPPAGWLGAPPQNPPGAGTGGQPGRHPNLDDDIPF